MFLTLVGAISAGASSVRSQLAPTWTASRTEPRSVIAPTKIASRTDKDQPRTDKDRQSHRHRSLLAPTTIC